MFGVSMRRVVHLEVSPTFYNLDSLQNKTLYSILCIHPPYDLEIVTAAFSRAAVPLRNRNFSRRKFDLFCHF